MKFLFTALLFILFSVAAPAADLSQIFPEDSQTSKAAQSYISYWLEKNCKDLKWALSVEEIPGKTEMCTDGDEKVHLMVELSHQKGEMVFWIKDYENRKTLDWIYEEFPAWRICSYSEAYFRDQKTCTP